MKNSDLPAMPHSTWDNEFEKVTEQGVGLTKREMFAMHAMQGYLSIFAGRLNAKDIARDSVAYADALLAELEK